LLSPDKNTKIIDPLYYIIMAFTSNTTVVTMTAAAAAAAAAAVLCEVMCPIVSATAVFQ
jgi:hypothetical protein